MRPLSATITANEHVLGTLLRLTLAAEPLSAARPGQWLALVRPDARDILPWPAPLTAYHARERAAEVLYDAARPRAAWLTALQPGARLQVLGPWGRPFPRDALARHAVLLATGRRLLGLLALATELVREGAAVVVLHDAATATALLPPALLPPAAEYHVATADGSAGSAGSVLDLLPPLLPWADTLYAALPAAAYPPLRDLVHRHRLRARRGFAHVLAEAPLACYAAACDGCAVPLRDGYGLLCKDGPAFDLLELA